MSRTVFAVIMAGGSGTRFWPASRGSRPKQLLPLAGGDASLIAETVERIAPLVPPERVLVVTSELLAEATAAELSVLPRENILAEPLGRNTAPCVGWAAAHVRRRDPNAVMMVLPADHHIGDPDTYRKTLETALRAADDGALVTVGILPTRPETGYGYIEQGESLGDGVRAVTRFVEKPDLARAEQFLASGHFVWNSGMFFFRADAVLAEFERQLPAHRGAAHGVRRRRAGGPRSRGGGRHVCVARERELRPRHHGARRAHRGGRGQLRLERPRQLDHRLRAGSEKTPPRTPCGRMACWWTRSGCYVSAPAGKLVALVGLHDLVVVDTGDALLIMPRERAQDVRSVVDALKSRRDPRV
jgi:mannose-1-phosphate guanylyltransferase